MHFINCNDKTIVLQESHYLEKSPVLTKGGAVSQMKHHRCKSKLLDWKHKIFKLQKARTLWKDIKFPARIKPISSPAS